MRKKTKLPQIMSRQKLASVVAIEEMGKSEAKIGDVRQILKIVSKLKKEKRFTWKIFK